MNTSKDSTARFEKAYLHLRGKESRLMDDEQVKLLPNLTVGPHANEWKLRARSSKRFVKYLTTVSQINTIIEVGCGNGWFTNIISCHSTANVWGLDINQPELDQAKQLFEKKKTNFIHFNLQTDQWQQAAPDLIVFNASIQYFPHLKSILLRALSILNKGGEIHIIDSPFYKANQLKDAKSRSDDYFKKMGSPEMSGFYFHHNIEDLLKFDPKFLYQPPKFPFNKFIKDSPFPWMSISKHNE